MGMTQLNKHINLMKLDLENSEFIAWCGRVAAVNG
jgi:hypothetical protein